MRETTLVRVSVEAARVLGERPGTVRQQVDSWLGVGTSAKGETAKKVRKSRTAVAPAKTVEVSFTMTPPTSPTPMTDLLRERTRCDCGFNPAKDRGHSWNCATKR